MNDTVVNMLLAPLAFLFYGSGLMLWPLRRWLRRKQKVRGRALAFVFGAQLIAYATTACAAVFVRLEHSYYWFIFVLQLNVVFTIAGWIAWLRDSRYERTLS